MLQDQEAIIRTFYGCSADDIAPRVVLNPVGWIQRHILQTYRVVRESSNWWEAATFVMGGLEYTAIHHGQGSKIVDVVLSLQGVASHLYMLGFAGGVGDGVRIGDVVIARAAGRPGGRTYPASPPGGWPGLEDGAAIRGGKVLTVDGLLAQEGASLPEPRQGDVSAIDLETFYFYKYAHRRFENYVALLAITDLPSSRPFYKALTTPFEAAEITGRLLGLVAKANDHGLSLSHKGLA